MATFFCPNRVWDWKGIPILHSRASWTFFYRYPEYRFLSHSPILAQIWTNPASRIAVKALYPGADSVSRLCFSNPALYFGQISGFGNTRSRPIPELWGGHRAFWPSEFTLDLYQVDLSSFVASEASFLRLRSGQASDEVARSRGILNRIGGRTFSLHADELTSAWLVWPSLSFPSVLQLKTSWLHSF